MPLMYQAATLQMEWCLECHRNPEKFLRPKSEVTAPIWHAPPNQLEVGIKLKADPKNLQGLCRDSNLLVGVAGANVLRLAPPLVIEDAHVREAVGVMDAALTEWVPG